MSIGISIKISVLISYLRCCIGTLAYMYAVYNVLMFYVLRVAISGQPAGLAAEYNKSCEDMYDEIVGLKKVCALNVCLTVV